MIGTKRSHRTCNELCVLSFLPILLISTLNPIECRDNGLAPTPPMGWNAWMAFRCNIDCVTYPTECVSERLFMDMADRMAADGWKELGYNQINMDDCWMSMNRTSDGKLIGDPKRFPNGIKHLADYIHSKGLKFGLYQTIGDKTCQGYPGSYGHYETDADTFAEWDVDFAKIDCCGHHDIPTSYEAYGDALNKTGHPMIYSCEWPSCHGIQSNFTAVAKTCNMWRTGKDAHDNWDSVNGIINFTTKYQTLFSTFQKPNSWNDPDMLSIGDYGLSLEQQKTEMAMWAIWGVPLLMGNDLRNVPDYAKEILQNKAIIAINQDKMGKMGLHVYNAVVPYGILDFYTKPVMPVGSFAVVVRQTLGVYPVKHNFTLDDINIHGNCFQVTEHFSGNQNGRITSSENYTAHLNAFGSIILSAIKCT